MWEMSSIFDKRLKYVGNDLEIWEMAKTFVKIAEVYGAQLKYLRNGISMLQMT